MVEIIDPGLATIEMGWWDPFGASVFAFSGFPAAFLEEAVIGWAGQGEFGDVGLSAVGAVTVCGV